MALFKKKKSEEGPTDTLLSVSPAVPAPENSVSSSLERLALSVIKDGVFIVDKQRVIRLANPSAITLTGDKDAELVVGMDVALSIRLEDQNGDLLLIEQNPVFHAVATNQPFESRDLVLVSNDGDKKIPVEISVIPSGDQDAERIISIRDITREKNEGDAQFEFISTASHEMRTPVASIEGYLGLALNPQTATIDERAKGYLEAAHTASQHLGKLFQDLLDVTKLDDKKIQPYFRPIILSDFLTQIVGGFQEKANFKKVQLSFSGPANDSSLRSLGQAIYVFVDIDFLNEIVSNLIDNAIKYTPSGKKIEVSLTTKDDQAVISVRDEGIGIASADIKHIFQKFYRADNSQTREIGGTGLGLYIVKQRTNALNGKVWAESVFGQGSTFFVALPKLTQEEYDKRMISFMNDQQLQKMQQMKQYQEITQRVLGTNAQTTSSSSEQLDGSSSQAPQQQTAQAPAMSTPNPVSSPNPAVSTADSSPVVSAQPAPNLTASPPGTVGDFSTPVAPIQNNQNIIQ